MQGQAGEFMLLVGILSKLSLRVLPLRAHDCPEGGENPASDVKGGGEKIP